jgi:hypothetical protein
MYDIITRLGFVVLQYMKAQLSGQDRRNSIEKCRAYNIDGIIPQPILNAFCGVRPTSLLPFMSRPLATIHNVSLIRDFSLLSLKTLPHRHQIKTARNPATNIFSNIASPEPNQTLHYPALELPTR